MLEHLHVVKNISLSILRKQNLSVSKNFKNWINSEFNLFITFDRLCWMSRLLSNQRTDQRLCYLFCFQLNVCFQNEIPIKCQFICSNKILILNFKAYFMELYANLGCASLCSELVLCVREFVWANETLDSVNAKLLKILRTKSVNKQKL